MFGEINWNLKQVFGQVQNSQQDKALWIGEIDMLQNINCVPEIQIT